MVTVAPALIRKEDEKDIFNYMLYEGFGAGLAKSKEEMQACLQYLSDLDFRVTTVGTDSINVWVNKEAYVSLKTNELDAAKKKDLREAKALWLNLIVGVFLQTLISSLVLAGATTAANYFFSLSIDVWAVFGWAALVVGILSVITNFLSMMTPGIR